MQKRTELIFDDIRLMVSGEHTFGSDALHLAEFSLPKNNETCCDMCCGCGIVSAAWLAKNPDIGEIAAVDISSSAIELLNESRGMSPLLSKVRPYLCDIRNIKDTLPHASFDAAACNPPYFAVGSGYVREGQEEQLARYEYECSIEDVCATAAYLLKYRGRLYMCHRPERLADVICTMRRYNIEPKRLRFVHHRVNNVPSIFLIEGYFGGRPSMIVEPPLIVEEEKKKRGREKA